MITSQDYDYLIRLLKDSAGMDLGLDKGYLIRSRLEPLAQKMEFQGLRGLFDRLQQKKEPLLEEAVVEAMLTNESLFFRDSRVFEKMKEIIIPKIIENHKIVRIWSAACSTGQEPYSLAMLLASMPWESQGCMFEILATDLSRSALSRAAQGVYTELEVLRGLNPQLLSLYFEKVSGGWRIKSDISKRVSFHWANLIRLDDNIGVFDVIFCRNVLIYCDLSVRKSVVQKLGSFLRPDGYLVLGSSENLLNVSETYSWSQDIGPSIYQRKVVN